jgi:hypothetical protein
MYPRLSWTTLKEYEECPQRYKLYREKKRTPIPERYVLTGNVVHYATEMLASGLYEVDYIYEQAGRDFDRRVAEGSVGWSLSEQVEQYERCMAGVEKMIELFTIPDYGFFAMSSEMELVKHYGGWTIEGYIDLARWGKTEEGLLAVDQVWDVKTGTSHEDGQLAFYSVLCEAVFGERPEKLGWIEPLGRGVVERVITPDAHMAMKQRIRDAARGIAGDVFTTSGFPKKCGRCSHAPWCPALENTRKMKLG